MHAFNNELVVPVDAPARPQLGEQEVEQVLLVPVEHLADLHEVHEARLLRPDSHHLRRSHHELLLRPGHHLRVLGAHDLASQVSKRHIGY